MIKQKILILKQDGEVGKYNLKFPSGTEFEIVADIVYMSGLPLPLEFQKVIYDWLVTNMSNQNMFREDLRRFN